MRQLPAIIVVMFCACAHVAHGQVVPEPVVNGLDLPSSVAFQPGTGVIFVAESGGGRIVRLRAGKPEIVVDDLSRFEPDASRPLGPLSLAFLASDLLFVGTKSEAESEQVRIYVVSSEPDPKAKDKKEESAKEQPQNKPALLKASFSLPMNEGEASESDAFGIVIADKSIFLTSCRADGRGRLAQFPRNGRNISPTAGLLNVDVLQRPTAITASPARDIVLAEMGELKESGDSLLTFFSENGKRLATFKTGLNDISGLAYSPRGNLYATDFSADNRSAGGLYQIISERKGRSQIVSAKRILKLQHPSSLAFADDGSLFITVYGAGTTGAGRLVRIKPGL